LKKVSGKDVKKLKSFLIPLFCFLAIANGAVKYLAEQKDVGNIRIEHSVQAPLPAKDSSVAQGSLVDDQAQPQPINKKININTATSIELQELIGIGPAKAGCIIEYRKEFGGFSVIEEINEVKGIGDATYAKIKEFITVE
jgi:comEA protein